MQFGIDIAQQRLSWDELVLRAKLGDQLGFDGAFGFDHYQPMYGTGPGECFEGMTTLAGLAGETSRIRLGLLVAGVTYRHPSVYCSQAITVDHLSRGRLDMSFGAAWFEPEHSRLGIGFPKTSDRFDLLEDSLEIVSRLMTGEVVSYQGKTTSLDNAQLLPRPVQSPHPPFWIGGTGARRTLPLVAKFADVWHSFANPDEYKKVSGQLELYCDKIGRNPKEIVKASSLSLSEDLSEVERNIDAYGKVGVEYLVISWPSEGAKLVERFAEKVIPNSR